MLPSPTAEPTAAITKPAWLFHFSRGATPMTLPFAKKDSTLALKPPPEPAKGIP